jgi:hypothetical protein
VLTTEDFGKQGVPPTHPELLDWLAVEFKQGGWSVKSLHRMIVTSATYRQSARARPELAAVDPYNELLARQSSLRLSAEQIRDATLAASGLLNRKIGGPCVYPPQPESVAMEGFDNKWQVSEGSDRVRRGLYTYIQRLSPFAQNVTFDAPALSRACTRRERSNTPLQALTLLNDPAFFEAARNLAAGVLLDRDPVQSPLANGGRVKSGIAERIDELYWRCLSRPPTVDETARLAAYYGQQLEILVRDPQAASEIFPLDVAGTDRVEAAAWTLVASVVLNLHEFITRD